MSTCLHLRSGFCRRSSSGRHCSVASNCTADVGIFIFIVIFWHFGFICRSSSGCSLSISFGIVCVCCVILFVRVVNIVDINGVVLDAIVGVAMGFKLDSSSARVGWLSIVNTLGFIGAGTLGCGAGVGGTGAATEIGTLRSCGICICTFVFGVRIRITWNRIGRRCRLLLGLGLVL